MATLGPAGRAQEDGEQNEFGTTAPLGGLGAVRIKASTFLLKIRDYTRAEVAQLSDNKLRSRQSIHWVILGESEYITHVEVKAAGWVDGLRIHTNLRSTRWYGGFGGDLQELRPQVGKINGFFGAQGARFVGRLGVHISPITEPPVEQYKGSSLGAPAAIITMKALGLGKAPAPHQRFDTQRKQLGAIVIKCDESIRSIDVVLPEVHARATCETDKAVYAVNDLVFAMRTDEFLTSVSVRCGYWLDAIRFHTNQRSSPWFGGVGGNPEEFKCAAGYRICGLYGRKNNTVVDLLGFHICENTPTVTKVGPVGLGLYNGQQDPFCDEPSETNLGAIVVKSNQYLLETTVYSRAEVAKLDPSEIHTEGKDGEYWFVLGPKEYVTLVEVRGASWIDGICIHTNLRSSLWCGGNGGQLHRLQPSPGYKIHGFFGTIGDNYVGRLGALCSPINKNAP